MTNIPMVDISDDAPFDEQLIKDAEAQLKTLTEDMKVGKINEIKVLQESAMNGGPSSMVEAIIDLMRRSNMGVRSLAQRIGMKRKDLQKILSGEVELPGEVISKCDTVFRETVPQFYK